MLGLLGKKIGMTQIFDENGVLIPVTVVKVEPNVVVGQRTKEKHGYDAVVLGAFKVKANKLKKPIAGQFVKGVDSVKILREFRDFEHECKIGDKLGVELFEKIRFVDVKGTTKGKGYQGVMKRHGFAGGVKSHGSKFHRAGGSTGQAAWPSKVLKGTKMAGRMGNAGHTMQNLRIVKIDKEKEVMLVNGAVPGAPNNLVIITRAFKKR
ncbi:MAG: 50S ribosomal protein L3 [Spirochaetales bacterium]|nr:50S ribosomal protein L3 [Spirochaetales bacterium]